MTSDEKFRLSEAIAEAIAEYLDGGSAYPNNVLRMPLAEYIVNDVIEDWVWEPAS